MTIKEFKSEVEKRFKDQKGQHRGQIAHNYLFEISPRHLEAIASGKYDPFVKEENLPDFYKFLKTFMDE